MLGLLGTFSMSGLILACVHWSDCSIVAGLSQGRRVKNSIGIPSQPSPWIRKGCTKRCKLQNYVAGSSWRLLSEVAGRFLYKLLRAEKEKKRPQTSRHGNVRGQGYQENIILYIFTSQNSLRYSYTLDGVFTLLFCIFWVSAECSHYCWLFAFTDR